MDTTLDGVTGDWGPQWSPSAWANSDGTVANNGPQVQNQDVFSAAVVTNGQDRWTGYFQTLLSPVVNYAIAKDAAQSGLRPATAANGQPIFVGAGVPALQKQNPANVLVLAALAVGAFVLAKHG
jgi:hypothetical protein